jgi:mannose-1-phosphate guanylyltransferase
MLWHPLAAMAKVPGLTEVIIIGFYEDAAMAGFVKESKREFPNIAIRYSYHRLIKVPQADSSYLREYRPLGTAGGLYHCKSEIVSRC